jgi:hypothetical protein
MIWDTELTDDEVFILDRCLKVAMSNGGSLKGYFRKIDIYNEVYFSNNVYLNNTNISNIFLSGTEFYKTSNWVINGTNIYNVNSGSIGINNTNPSSSYKLDVSGVINTNSNFNLSASSSTSVGIFWSSYGTTGIGCAGADSQYSTSSLSGDMIIRSQEGKRLILQNGSNAGALFIYSSNVGIGINSPSSFLHLHNSNNSGEVKILLTDASTGASATNGFSIYKSGADDGYIWNYSNASMRFGTNNAEYMTILSNGNIGIGTTNPSSLFHLYNSNASGEVKLLFTDGSTGTTATSGFSIYKATNEEGFIWNYSNASIKFGTSNTERMVIQTSGNIGIGTTNPSSLVHLHNSNASGEVKLLFTDGSTGTSATSGFSIFKSGGDEGNIWNYSNASIRFGTSNTERMCVSSSGNIGIGTTNPSSLIHLHNSNSSGEVKILLTDGSTGIGTTSGFSIFKSGSDDGNIWNYSNASIRFGTSNVERMSILSSGNIGIGTTNPSSLIHLHSSNASGEVKILLTDGSTGSNATSGFSIFKSGTDEGNIWNYSNASIRFGTSNTERMCLISSGNIGIGTTNPSSLIHLHNTNSLGEVKLLFTDGSTGTSASSGFAIFKSGGDDGYIWNYSNTSIRLGTSNAERMCVLSSGNIGFGTNNPSSLLHLHNTNASGEVKILLTDGSTGIGATSGFSIYKSGDDNGYIWNYSNASIRFGTSNIERLCLSSSGNIGIGTTNPSSILHLHSGSSSTEVKILLTDNGTGSSSTSGFSIYKSTGNEGYIWNYSNASLRFGTNNTERLTILNNGNIGINNTSPSYLLDVNGTINATAFRGDGSLLSNLSLSGLSSSTVFTVSQGGTGASTFSAGRILFGNGTSAINTSSNLFWDNSSNKLGIGKTNPATALDVNGTITATSFIGSGSSITSLNATNITVGVLGVDRGGTGASTFSAGQVLFGNGTSAINSSANLYWNNSSSFLGIGKTNPASALDVNGTIIATNFSGNGSAITSLNVANITTGTLSVGRGGIGTTTLPAGRVLFGNDATAINTNSNLFWDNTNSRLGIGKTNPATALDVNGTITATNFSGNGSAITSLNIANISSGTLGVIRGGTGATTFPSGRILFGSDQSPINTTSNLFWDNTNSRLGVKNTAPAYTLDVSGDINFTGSIRKNGLVYTTNPAASQWTASGNNLYFSGSNVGIGLTNPTYKLDVNGNVRSDYLTVSSILFSNNSITFNNSTSGGGSLIFNKRVSGVSIYDNARIEYTESGVILNNDSFMSTGNLMYFNVRTGISGVINGYWFDGAAFVGIGTAPDSNIRLKVGSLTSASGYRPSTSRAIEPTSSNINTYVSSLINNISAYIDGNLLCTGNLYVSSDIRIKNDINDINSLFAIDKILKIKPITFKYIDYIENGYNDNYGFIAQQIKEVIPEAVFFTEEFIPNIFKLFDINKDIIQTNEDLRDKLNIDDTIRLINNNKIECKILEITDTFIKIDKSLEDDKIFVYGKKIKDFHNINKNIIFTLNVSATQELHKRLEIQEKRIQEQEELLKDRERRLKENEEKIEKLFQLLAMKQS